jgi:cancer susceptibility candidate protein 1
MKLTEDWEKFLLCSTKPDSVRESELTTFITMYRESKSITDMKTKEELGMNVNVGLNIIKTAYNTLSL